MVSSSCFSFQGPLCFQLVMELHGCGMDLWTFLDRRPGGLDEALAAHLFRQVAEGVKFLHDNNVGGAEKNIFSFVREEARRGLF